MREINEILIHCSYTKPSMDIGYDEIRVWHVVENKWSDVGYNYIIRRNGLLENGRDLDKDGDVNEEIGAHARGHNVDSIGICLVGGMDEDGKPDCNFTIAQYEALSMLFDELDIKFPGIKLSGHRDYSDKECPCFDVNALLT